MAVLHHLEVCAADGAGNDIQEGFTFRALRVWEILQIQEAGAFGTAAFMSARMSARDRTHFFGSSTVISTLSVSSTSLSRETP